MPVPASESGDGLQTPEVSSQNELYGLYGSKMDDSFGLDFLASATGATTLPRGSILGADPSFKFDPECSTDVNLDAKESTSHASPFNVDDLLNLSEEFKFLDDCSLPLSSQEMNTLCNPIDATDDCGQIGMSIEEQNDTPASSSSRWFGGVEQNAAAAAVKPSMDKYSQFAVAPVNTTPVAVHRPDIVQSALVQSEALTNNNNVCFSAEDLAGATFVMLPSGHDDPALNQFITIDSSGLLHLENRDLNANDGNNNDVGPAAIPLTVEQAVEPVASTSAAFDAVPSTAPDSVIAAGALKRENDAVDTTFVATASSSRGGRKRKAASSIAAGDDDDEDWDADADVLNYKEKRRRNNLAVRKSRALAKEKSKTTEAENETLRKDNEKKSREIEILQREIKIYKELFERTGFSLPRK